MLVKSPISAGCWSGNPTMAYGEQQRHIDVGEKTNIG